MEGVATSTTLTGLTGGTAYEVQVRASNAEGDGAWSDSGRGATVRANAAPSFPGSSGGVTREIAENSVAGASVGDPVTATDPDGDALTYSLSGASEFVIGEHTGQIKVAEGAVLDYETDQLLHRHRRRQRRVGRHGQRLHLHRREHPGRHRRPRRGRDRAVA